MTIVWRKLLAINNLRLYSRKALEKVQLLQTIQYVILHHIPVHAFCTITRAKTVRCVQG